MKRTAILLFFLLLSMFSVVSIYAQTASSRYNEANRLFRKGDKEGAIRALKSSMILDKSDANKRKCQNLINKINSSGKKDYNSNSKNNKNNTSKKDYYSTTPYSPDNDVFYLRQHQLNFDGNEAGQAHVIVKTSKIWDAEVDEEKDRSWCQVNKAHDDDSILVVSVKPSNLTATREATIHVFMTYSRKNKREVKVIQRGGMKATIAASKPTVANIDRAGGNVVVPIFCNSDTLYSDGKNWEVAEFPSWVKVVSTKLFRKNPFAQAVRVDAEKSELSIECAPNPTKEERRGKIVLVSQDAQCEINLIQKKGNKNTGAY